MSAYPRDVRYGAGDAGGRGAVLRRRRLPLRPLPRTTRPAPRDGDEVRETHDEPARGQRHEEGHRGPSRRRP